MLSHHISRVIWYIRFSCQFIQLYNTVQTGGFPEFEITIIPYHSLQKCFSILNIQPTKLKHIKFKGLSVQLVTMSRIFINL